MLQIINKPYPAPQHGPRNLWAALYFGLFIGSFLIFFEPFDIHKLEVEFKTLKIAFYGFIATAVMIFFFHLLPFLLPKYITDRHWTVKHQIIYFMLMLFCVATFNGIYTNFINGYSYNWANSLWMIKITMILGSIPICIYVLVDHNRKLSQHIKAVSKLNFKQATNAAPTKTEEITIPLALKNEQLKINPSTLLYVQAEGNYSQVVQMISHKIKKQLYRATLSHLEKHFVSDNIIRCHRSYLVNLDMIEKVNGNAQGFKLTLKNSDGIIPVSRKYIPVLKKYLSRS